jgi:anti-sigma B factor antagonist
MKLAVAKDDDQGARVRISGKVTQHDFASVQEPLADLLGPSVYGRHVTLDLTDTMYLDSSGVGWLLTCHKRLREKGGKLTLENVPSIVTNLLRLLKLSRLLGVDPPGTDESFQAEGLA